MGGMAKRSAAMLSPDGTHSMRCNEAPGLFFDDSKAKPINPQATQSRSAKKKGATETRHGGNPSPKDVGGVDANTERGPGRRGGHADDRQSSNPCRQTCDGGSGPVQGIGESGGRSRNDCDARKRRGEGSTHTTCFGAIEQEGNALAPPQGWAAARFDPERRAYEFDPSSSARGQDTLARPWQATRRATRFHRNG